MSVYRTNLQDHWSSGYYMSGGNLGSLLYGDVSVLLVAKDLENYGIVSKSFLLFSAI